MGIASIVQPAHDLVSPLEIAAAAVTVATTWPAARKICVPRFADRGDRFRIHVIAVNIGDQNQIGFWQSAEIRGLCRIDVNILATRFDQHRGVIKRRNFHGGPADVSKVCIASILTALSTLGTPPPKAQKLLRTWHMIRATFIGGSFVLVFAA